MCGVGPADRTGKSVVRYCPGGSFAPADVRRPENPRETTVMACASLSLEVAAALDSNKALLLSDVLQLLFQTEYFLATPKPILPVQF